MIMTTAGLTISFGIMTGCYLVARTDIKIMADTAPCPFGLDMRYEPAVDDRRFEGGYFGQLPSRFEQSGRLSGNRSLVPPTKMGSFSCRTVAGRKQNRLDAPSSGSPSPSRLVSPASSWRCLRVREIKVYVIHASVVPSFVGTPGWRQLTETPWRVFPHYLLLSGPPAEAGL